MNYEQAQKVEKIAIGIGGVSVGMSISMIVLRPKIKKIITMNKLANELLNWGIQNGIRMPTVEQDHELYEKLAFLGLAHRGMK